MGHSDAMIPQDAWSEWCGGVAAWFSMWGGSHSPITDSPTQATQRIKYAILLASKLKGIPGRKLALGALCENMPRFLLNFHGADPCPLFWHPNHQVNAMLYKLAFSYSESGPFRVTAVPIGFGDAQPTTAVYEDNQEFLRLLERARLGLAESLRLISASLVAFSSPGVPACCEEIILDERQLGVLKLNGNKQQAAS